MATCKNCIHCDVCGRKHRILFSDEELAKATCRHFKDSSLMIELPCPIGTTYYRIVERDGKHVGRFSLIRAAKLNYYNIDKVIEDIGKTVFLDREEAERALAERSGE